MSKGEKSTSGRPGETKAAVDTARREAMVRMAKYTAPAMLALLASSQLTDEALACVSPCT
jgi:ethanolamine utilization microcompartment shell protein EutL